MLKVVGRNMLAGILSSSIHTQNCFQSARKVSVLILNTCNIVNTRKCVPIAFSTVSNFQLQPHVSSKSFSTEAETNSTSTENENKPLPTIDVKAESKSQSEVGNQLPSEESGTGLDKLFKTVELEILGYESSVLDSYQWFVLAAAKHLSLTVGKCWSPLKSDKLRFALLKSAHVHKKHQVHYEVRTYHRFINFHKITGSTADTFLEYIERNLPEGVGLKVTKVEVKPLPNYLEK